MLYLIGQIEIITIEALRIVNKIYTTFFLQKLRSWNFDLIFKI